MSNTIWLVTAGAYSGYHIEAAFSSKKVAEEYVEVRNEGEPLELYGASVEEYKIYDEIPPKETIYYGGTFLYEDGTNDGIRVNKTTAYPWNLFETPYINGRPRLQVDKKWWTTNPRKKQIRAIAWKHDEAVKVVADRLALEKAKLEGLA